MSSLPSSATTQPHKQSSMSKTRTAYKLTENTLN